MLAGPWQPRSEMCEASTAGVASVISAVETLPTFLPSLLRALEDRLAGSCRGRRSRVLGPCEIRSSIVFWPVAQAVPVEAESGS